jgi:hypothetical protein
MHTQADSIQKTTIRPKSQERHSEVERLLRLLPTAPVCREQHAFQLCCCYCCSFWLTKHWAPCLVDHVQAYRSRPAQNMLMHSRP